MKIRSNISLISLLLISSLVLSIAGMLNKNTVGKAAEQLQDALPVTVPFMLMQDKTILAETEVKNPQDNNSNTNNNGENSSGQTTQPTDNNEGNESKPPQFRSVKENYFDDALFIGDSRTVGLAAYGRLGKADYFAITGMSVFNLLSTWTSDENFAETDLGSLLSKKQYGKIYLMLGINEAGYDLDTLISKYQSIIDYIHSTQENAIIILCANLYVTEAKAASVSWLSLANIQRLNEAIGNLADNKTVFYLDANEIFCDESGYMDPDLTSDGVHPYATGYAAWSDWLQQHGI